MSAALPPAAAEIAGLPGAPVRADMTPGAAPPAVAGTTSVYDYSTEYEDYGGASFWATPAMAHRGLGTRDAAGLHHLVRLRADGAGIARPNPGAGGGGALRAVQLWHLMSGGALEQQGPMVIEAGAAALIAITTHSPFGEAERTTGRWLPYLRLGAALALTGIAIGALQLGVTGASLSGGVLMLARNVIGIAGIGLLSSLITGGVLAWIPPLGYLGFAEYALNATWRNPWTWPVRPPADRGAWICAAGVFAIGLAAVTFRGARTSLADNG